MENMEIYEKVKSVPDYAKKIITSGRMNGKTDIRPMWRIQQLTDLFGPCGIGWWYVIKSQRLETGANGVISAFVDIDLYYKWNGEVSQPIPGIGGNSFVAKETGGLHTSDECFKMALTDAISVAAKALGVGADVYMGGDETKYSRRSEDDRQQSRRDAPPPPRKAGARQPPRDGRGAEQPPYRQAASGSTLPPHGEARKDAEQTVKPELAPDGYYYCQDCGEIIRSQRRRDGGIMSAAEVAAMALERQKKQLCAECLKKRIAAESAVIE